MSSNLIPIKAFLGKYYSELQYSAQQEKYKNAKLDSFFEQRFLIQANKVQMIVDPLLPGITAIVSGNEIHISKGFYDHPNIVVTNSLENQGNQNSNPKSLYTPDTFSTIAYLICQNHTMFQIVGNIDEPIYVKYTSDYESFYNSVLVFEVSDDVSIEIVEEIASNSAVNSVTNYILHSGADIKLTTFYQNNVSGLSFVFRNIIAQEASSFNHLLFGKGSSNIVDENKILAYPKTNLEFLGVVNSNSRNFHSVLTLQPMGDDYFINIDYRDIIYGKGNVSFHPVIIGSEPAEKATIMISNIILEEMPKEKVEEEIKKYINDIVEKAELARLVGVQRFYNNKAKFLHFP